MCHYHVADKDRRLRQTIVWSVKWKLMSFGFALEKKTRKDAGGYLFNRHKTTDSTESTKERNQILAHLD